MTFSQILQIGDKVVFNVDPERREHTNTYDNIPDGTVGVVCGFYDAVIYCSRVPVFIEQPGVYHRKGAVFVWLPDGRIIQGGHSIKMVDEEERRRRDTAMRDERGILKHTMVRLGDLPPTNFWESDKVRVRFPDKRGEREMVIHSIEYDYIHKCRADGSPWPFYNVKSAESGSTTAEESWIELIERGNVWNYYNNQPCSFADIKEEANFFALLDGFFSRF